MHPPSRPPVLASTDTFMHASLPMPVYMFVPVPMHMPEHMAVHMSIHMFLHSYSKIERNDIFLTYIRQGPAVLYVPLL